MEGPQAKDFEGSHVPELGQGDRSQRRMHVCPHVRTSTHTQNGVIQVISRSDNFFSFEILKKNRFIQELTPYTC